MFKHFSDSRHKITFFYVLKLISVFVMAMLTSIIVVFVLRLFIPFGREQTGGLAIMLSWFIICTVYATIAIYRIGREFIRTIITMNKATKEVAQGNFDVRINPDKAVNIEEIEQLYENFNYMVKELGTIETLRSDFVADVSHEFKTPIAAIEGYAMLLQDDTLSNDEKKEYIDSILYNSKRLTNLTGNILMISRLENETMRINRTDFSLDEQIRRIILTFEEAWSEKELDLDIDLDAVTYYGDEDLLYNVWLNLISNAVKFSVQGGTVKVKLIDNKYNVKVYVEDNGIGMSETAKTRIFEKFYQSDTSRASQGNGLGMTLVKKILDLCGANIEIESTLGKGTKFIVKLPIYDKGESY